MHVSLVHPGVFKSEDALYDSSTRAARYHPVKHEVCTTSKPSFKVIMQMKNYLNSDSQMIGSSYICLIGSLNCGGYFGDATSNQEY